MIYSAENELDKYVKENKNINVLTLARYLNFIIF
jgi:hypothetical protein